MKELSIVLNIITILVVAAFSYIVYLSYVDREVRSDTVFDVIQEITRDNNAISASRARMVPKYGDIGDFTNFDVKEYTSYSGLRPNDVELSQAA